MDTCFTPSPPPLPLPPPPSPAFQAMEDSNFKLVPSVPATNNISPTERKAKRSSRDYIWCRTVCIESSSSSHQGEGRRGDWHGVAVHMDVCDKIKNVEVSSVEFKNQDRSTLVEDQREKDRLFWETCLASGYP